MFDHYVKDSQCVKNRHSWSLRNTQNSLGISHAYVIGMKKTKIDGANLEPHCGKQVSLYCQVGVFMLVKGKLVKGRGLCQWGVELSNGDLIGFSFGEFGETVDGEISIQIF